MMNSIDSLQPNWVVFNWECSSSYNPKTFPEGVDKVFKFLEMIIDRGHMAMFSDFSLKALIKQWRNEDYFGPNPFVHISSYGGKFDLRFDP